MTAPSGGSAQVPAEASLIEDYIDIWFKPSAVYARRSGGGWFGPYLLTSLLLAVLFYAAMGSMQGVLDAQMTKAIADAQAQNPQMTSEQLASMQGVMETSMKYGGLVALPVVIFLLGLGVWAVSRVLGGELSLGGGIMVASFAYLPKVLETVLVIVQGMLLDTSTWSGRYQHSWGVGRFMEPGATEGVYNFLGRVDVFTLWVTILVAIGLQYAGKVEKNKAYIGGALIWILGAVPALYQIVTGK